MYTSEISKFKQFRKPKLDEQEINSAGKCFTLLESKIDIKDCYDFIFYSWILPSDLDVP